MRVHGTTNLYGHSVGILMIEGWFPRLPGAIGNATTFSFPVLHKAWPRAGQSCGAGEEAQQADAPAVHR